MTKWEVLCEAKRFRAAMERARDAEEFNYFVKPNLPEKMNKFPDDCCDISADLFVHYLYHQYEIISTRIDGDLFDEYLGFTRGHSWQETEGWLIDLTGDQFDNEKGVIIKSEPVYVGHMDDFHRQFQIRFSEPSCGIECLGEGCQDRMYGLYTKIMKYLK